MKRDFDVIRDILFQAEAAPSGVELQTLTGPRGIDEAVLGEHLQIMIEHGLIAGHVVSLKPLSFIIERLTWTGHDFINNARNDKLWKKAIAEIKAKGWAMTIPVLEGVLAAAAKKMAGL